MSVSIDQQFVEYVVKSLVSHPDEVKIDRRVDEKGVLLELTVHPEDLGRVIGKRGATAQSIRTLLRALGTKQEARYNLKIVDVDKLDAEGNPLPRPQREDRPEKEAAPVSAAAPADELAGDDTSAPVTATTDDDLDEEDLDTTPKESDAIARTRAELADLDDLDI